MLQPSTFPNSILLTTLLFMLVGMFCNKIECQLEPATIELSRNFKLDSLSYQGKLIILEENRSDFLEQVNAPLYLDHRKKTLNEAKVVSMRMFLDLLDSKDLLILDQFWNLRIEKERLNIVERGQKYEEALRCQKQVISSVINSYIDTLEYLFLDMKKDMEVKDIRTLTTYNELGVAKLRKKKDEFLAHELKFTYDVSKSIYEYLDYGFQIMEYVPSSYYYNLLGAKGLDSTFLTKYSDNDYLKKYSDFESTIDSLLNEQGCRAHSAIPFYHRALKTKVFHTKLNSLLFAQNNGWLEKVKPKKMNVNWPECVKFPDSVKLNLLEEFINQTKLDDSNFQLDDNSTEYEKLYGRKNGFYSNFLYVQLLNCESTALKKYQDKFSSDNLLKKLTLNSDDSELYITSKNTGNLYEVEVLINYKNQYFILTCLSAKNIDIESDVLYYINY